MNSQLPRHVAIIMDGNGRWAKQRNLPRVAGHRAGVESVREIVQACLDKGVEILSLFTFSSENWRRPLEEVNFLMDLFYRVLKREIKKLHENNVQLRVIGDLDRFEPKLRKLIHTSEKLTSQNTKLKLVLAMNYGGRWDIANAVRHVAQQATKKELKIEDISPALIQSHLSLADLPDPDLFIRTSGEQRLSNFFLWQLAYTELFFTDTYWPDFKLPAFEEALQYYATRERRFGYTGDQIIHGTIRDDKQTDE